MKWYSQKKWNHHQRVFDTLSPLLPDDILRFVLMEYLLFPGVNTMEEFHCNPSGFVMFSMEHCQYSRLCIGAFTEAACYSNVPFFIASMTRYGPLFKEYDIYGVPTFLLIENGTVVKMYYSTVRTVESFLSFLDASSSPPS
jgi:hypothetical protein